MISDYQIQSVIRAYMENMKTQIAADGNRSERETVEDHVALSQESIRKLLIDKVEKHVTQRMRRSEFRLLTSVGSGESNHE